MARRGSTKFINATRLLPALLPNFASGDPFPSARVHRQSNRILYRIRHLALACELRCRRDSPGPGCCPGRIWPTPPVLGVPS
jgi:hypothetical protein